MNKILHLKYIKKNLVKIMNKKELAKLRIIKINLLAIGDLVHVQNFITGSELQSYYNFIGGGKIIAIEGNKLCKRFVIDRRGQTTEVSLENIFIRDTGELYFVI